ncbi:MAG: hypothetical protein H7Y13_09380 [Sphingobacteriaceae bacterium]|nr:hypothetical protein [Sphingobacteriaceae bacterium]
MRFSQPILLLIFLTACSGKENLDNRNHYFDIKGYFTKEAERLQQDGPVIEKTVSQNNGAEVKDVKLTNWSAELELFAESDINKPAWKDSYDIVRNGPETRYVAKDTSLRTKSIAIVRSPKGDIRKIVILNKTKNALYSSEDELVYIPDSIYQIKKHQSVSIIGRNSYAVSARFKN